MDIGQKNASGRYFELSKPSGLAWGSVVLLLTAFVSLPMLTPFLGDEFRSVVYTAFKPLCHQSLNRSFIINGVPFAVCHRCTGIYAGIWFAGLVFPYLYTLDRLWWGKARWLLLVAVLPIVLDVGLHWIGWHHNTEATRLISGLVFGIVGGYFVVRGLVDLFLSFRKTSPAKEQSEASL